MRSDELLVKAFAGRYTIILLLFFFSRVHDTRHIFAMLSEKSVVATAALRESLGALQTKSEKNNSPTLKVLRHVTCRTRKTEIIKKNNIKSDVSASQDSPRRECNSCTQYIL